MAALSLGQARTQGRTAAPYSALVVTVVHNPEDARIRQGQINALIEAGWHVTYVAPFADSASSLRKLGWLSLMAAACGV
ncbi:MAG TPA: hypothetical protein VJ625_09095 [Propionibacteriaceae bacterium]|nr:hypothetical protein [Propionibacteriaceae bacterium]